MKRTLLRLGAVAAVLAGVGAAASVQEDEPGLMKPVSVGDRMWLQQSTDVPRWGSNVAWIEFDKWVVVIDSAFPRGAERALRNIRETTGNKPVRYVIVTHYHADHSFGSGVFAKEGAIIVSHENARDDYLKRNLESYRKRQEESDAAAKVPARAPGVTFTDRMVIDDGTRRAELRYFGHAHTSGCMFTWLPKERVLFTGDACVNGPYNYMGDSDSASWIGALSKAQALDPETVVPGHGRASDGGLLALQKNYFVELRRQVGALLEEGKSDDEILKAVDIPEWKKWTGEKEMKAANIAHVAGELRRDRSQGRAVPGLVPERRVRRFLDLTGAGGLGRQVLDGLREQFRRMPDLPPGFLEKFTEMAEPGELVDRVVPIYARHLESDALEAAIAYYETPEGQRFLKAQPAMLRESMAASQEWGKEVARRALEALEKERER